MNNDDGKQEAGGMVATATARAGVLRAVPYLRRNQALELLTVTTTRPFAAFALVTLQSVPYIARAQSFQLICLCLISRHCRGWLTGTEHAPRSSKAGSEYDGWFDCWGCPRFRCSRSPCILST